VGHTLTSSLLVMWNDIDMYHAVRDFTTDPVTFPVEEVKRFAKELVRSYINIRLG
jgi:alpha-glucosidase